MMTVHERAKQERQKKLDQMREQVENGSLVIRQMTKEERRRYPPRPQQAEAPRSRSALTSRRPNRPQNAF